MTTPLVYNLYNNIPLKIGHVEMNLLSPEEILRTSVYKVTDTTWYEKSIPKPNGLNDIRGGPPDRRFRCGTCGRRVDSCNGHHGHIELPYYVYHVGFLDTIHKVLSMVCFFCCRPTFDTTDPKYQQILKRYSGPSHTASRFTAFTTLKTATVCPRENCKGPQPIYKKKGNISISCEWPELTTFSCPEERNIACQPFTAREAHNILEHVHDDDYRLLGFNPQRSRLDWAIFNVMVCPTIFIRPAIMDTRGSKTRGQDDLTIKLTEILKVCKEIEGFYETEEEKTNSPVDKATIQVPAELIDKLQFHCATYIDNKIRGQKSSTQRSGTPLKAYAQRWKGKLGRFRGNLNGKRVDFSARAVISPDANIRTDELGIPAEVTMELTFPERVTCLNIKELTERVHNGPDVLYGAKTVIDTSNGEYKVIYLDSCLDRTNIQLSTGWIVERHLKNGDAVVFNRQPSLHKMSMMCHRVKILPWNTFRLNLSVTTPYGADFDGDEMNLHAVQSLMAKSEIQELMGVAHQIVSAQNNRPVMGIVQDNLIGSFFFTCKNVFLTRGQVMDLICQITLPIDPSTVFDLPIPAILKPCPLWTGKQIFSLLIDRKVNLVRQVRDLEEESVMDMDERNVVIQRGHLICGSLCKQTLGAIAGGLIHVMYKDVGHQQTCNFLTNVQNVVTHWIMQRGFSIGIDDCTVDDKTRRRIEEAIDKTLDTLDDLSNLAKRKDGTIGPMPGYSAREMEAYIASMSNKILDYTGRIAEENTTVFNNSMYALSYTGSRGNKINGGQVRACVGQQSNEGKRIDPGNQNRQLTCYEKGSVNVEHFGFVTNSYATGLTPQEFFFAAIGAREGLVDTAVKTSYTGYLQRLLSKGMESNKVEWDGTVRASNGDIIHYAYGHDRIDGVFIEKVTMKTLLMSNAEIKEFLGDVSCPDELERFLHSRDQVRYTKSSILVFKMDDVLFIPIHVPRLVFLLYQEWRDSSEKDQAVPATSEQVLSCVDGLIQKMRRVCTPLCECVFMEFAIRSELTIKHVTQKMKLPLTTLNFILESILVLYQKSFAQPGEMVGELAASSIGEPGTQMTLRTFHYSGVASKNVTLGVPRIKELINSSKNMKRPSTWIPLKPPYKNSERGANIVKHALQYTTFADFVKSSMVVSDSCFFGKEEQMMCQTMQVFEKFEQEQSVLGKRKRDHDDATHNNERSFACTLVIRYVLDKTKLLDAGLGPKDMAKAVENFIQDHGHVQSSEYNMKDWVIRIKILYLDAMMKRLFHKKSKKQDLDANNDAPHAIQIEQKILTRIKNVIPDIIYVSGIKGITKAIVVQNCLSTFEPETGKHIIQKEWAIDTEGSCLEEILSLPFVDASRVYCNDPHEVLKELGIEGAASILYKEIKDVMSFDGTYVNDRHLMLTVDTMTRDGKIKPLNRHGINTIDGNFLYKSSFEETVDMIFQAATFADKDPVCGVTDNICLGQLCPIGTGFVDVMSDEKKALHSLGDEATDYRNYYGKDLKIVKTIVEEKNVDVPENVRSDASFVYQDGTTKKPRISIPFVPSSPSRSEVLSCVEKIDYEPKNDTGYRPSTPEFIDSYNLENMIAHPTSVTDIPVTNISLPTFSKKNSGGHVPSKIIITRL